VDSADPCWPMTCNIPKASLTVSLHHGKAISRLFRSIR
jgi:hypothetical protein